MQGPISNKNVFFSTYFEPADIPVYDGEPPEETCQELVWAVFRTCDAQRFQLQVQSARICCNKRVELCRVPGVAVEFHQGEAGESYVDVVGAEFNRSFRTFDELKAWRGQ